MISNPVFLLSTAERNNRFRFYIYKRDTPIRQFIRFDQIQKFFQILLFLCTIYNNYNINTGSHYRNGLLTNSITEITSLKRETVFHYESTATQNFIFSVADLRAKIFQH